MAPGERDRVAGSLGGAGDREERLDVASAAHEREQEAHLIDSSTVAERDQGAMSLPSMARLTW